MFSDRQQISPVDDYQSQDWSRYVRRAIKAEYCGRVLARALQGEHVAKDMLIEAQTYFLWGKYNEHSESMVVPDRHSGTSAQITSAD